MTPELTSREEELMRTYTEVRVYPGGKDLSKKAVLLKIENQRFYIGLDPYEDEDDIFWMRAMLAKALAQFLREQEWVKEQP